MGRPRQHDARTGAALLDTAERIIEQDGLADLTVRRLAHELGTTTRSVYSVFGSKEALVIALGSRAFDWLAEQLDAVPVTEDPAADLVTAGAGVFRRLVTEHPALFRIGIQHTDVASGLESGFRAAAENAMTRLITRFARLRDAGLLGERTVRDAACQFHALCEGLAAIELRGQLTPGHEERVWRGALTALVVGFARS